MGRTLTMALMNDHISQQGEEGLRRIEGVESFRQSLNAKLMMRLK